MESTYHKVTTQLQIVHLAVQNTSLDKVTLNCHSLERAQ